MPGEKPNTVYLYRIIHIDNLEYLLKNGIFHRHHQHADPNYINIGDSDLIAKRHDYPVGVNPPGGNLGEYVPFYFGPLSPMLLNIKTGDRGVTKRPQEDIIYLVCKVESLIEHCAEWCFTDGHAKNKISAFYNDLIHLDEVNWDNVAERYWRNTKDDFDRMRTKQAEFLVKEHVPVDCIFAIVTYNKVKADAVKAIVQQLSLNIIVGADSKKRFYYY